MRTTKTLSEIEAAAAAKMIDFGKSSDTIPSMEAMEAVLAAFEVSGADDTTLGGKEARKERRWIEAQCILRDCITRTNRTELRKIERALKIMSDAC